MLPSFSRAISASRSRVGALGCSSARELTSGASDGALKSIQQAHANVFGGGVVLEHTPGVRTGVKKLRRGLYGPKVARCAMRRCALLAGLASAPSCFPLPQGSAAQSLFRFWARRCGD